ncbi:tRNA uracil 4-sulfurtransferase ThiI [Geosporobacter ferrireducens]|uniref:Probable tRNA sulfurtransferase n=1 Tax=Geosporobacter ferrireducens TaxID=1424294 RepID=A0A1D8GCN5_9FIRM|nr:tRNA uracil 4-sulfurtransferase ThiI [Geosporobacter ferrireducens]AOT68669.1 tRNA 4-thiouridine(8) synthase ThiI [Geosporobacter ferrireducens]MTI54146.1 tRNA 4-thiouridine(8) synthase ThiI [Geosporobacter ferrireducens]
MKKVLIIRYGEIALKGLNKSFFEDKLVRHIELNLRTLGKAKVHKSNGMVFADIDALDEAEAIAQVTKVFGVVSVSPAHAFEIDMDQIYRVALEHTLERLKEGNIKTFKVESRRGDKRFPMNSLEIAREVGGYILSNVDGLKVDVHQPDLTIHVEIRDRAYVFSKRIQGLGGLPLGTNGKAMLLLSGGIDSPVAGWMVAKRGVMIESVHYHSYPFTSERAKEKVIDLARILSQYCGKIRMHNINLLPIQKEINEKCPPEEMTILSRRFMMKIAERLAIQEGCDGLITGESIGQVASQTVQGLTVTNAAVSMPVFRPLIATDKSDIVDLARKIGTFETSILPYEDCCTVFLPKRPVTKPKLERILLSENKLDVEALIEEAIKNVEILEIEQED